MDCCGVQLCPFTMSMAGPGPPSPAVPRPQGGPQLAINTVNGHSWMPTEPRLNRHSHMLAQLGTDGVAARGEGSRTQPRWGQSHNPQRPRLLAQGRRRATYTPLPRWAGILGGVQPTSPLRRQETSSGVPGDSGHPQQPGRECAAVILGRARALWSQHKGPCCPCPLQELVITPHQSRSHGAPASWTLLLKLGGSRPFPPSADNQFNAKAQN